jgi:hypothetical protein
MQWSDLPLNPSQRILRQFSALWVVLLSGLAVWHGLVHHESRLAAILIALAVAGTPGLVAPKWMRPVFVAMTIAGLPIGWVVSRVVLFVLFIVVITPLGVAFRLRGRDPLLLRRPSGRTSYWAPKPAAPDVASYFRQY